MDKIQKEWVLETFFKKEQFPGWRNIAEKLLDTGKCITTSKIWIGGIGNFIDSKDYEGEVGLVELTFDKDSFLSVKNKYFIEYYRAELKKTIAQMKKLTEYSDSISNII